MQVNEKFNITYFDRKTEREVSVEVRVLQIRVNGEKMRKVTGLEKRVTLTFCMQGQPTVAFYGVSYEAFEKMRQRFEEVKK